MFKNIWLLLVLLILIAFLSILVNNISFQLHLKELNIIINNDDPKRKI